MVNDYMDIPYPISITHISYRYLYRYPIDVRYPISISRSYLVTLCQALSQGVIATGSKDQRIKLWDFETGRLLAEEHGHCASVLSLTFSADGGTLVGRCRLTLSDPS